jgi:hypothetical protein
MLAAKERILAKMPRRLVPTSANGPGDHARSNLPSRQDVNYQK